MTEKVKNLLAWQTVTLLISLIVMNIINYIWDGGWIAFGVMLGVLIPQIIFLLVVVIYKLRLEKDEKHYFFIFILMGEIIGLLLIGLQSFDPKIGVVGFSLMYITVAISWILIMWCKGVWGKRYANQQRNKPAK